MQIKRNIFILIYFINLNSINANFRYIDSNLNENEIEVYYNINKQIENKINSLYLLIDSITKIKFINKNKTILKLSKQIDLLKSIEKVKNDIDFVIRNPSSLFSLELLYNRIYASPELPKIDSIRKLYNNLSAVIKNSIFGDSVNNIIKLVERNQLGNYVPYFNFFDSKNNFINSNYLKEKSILYLIDFSASWCIPCREDIPFLKSIFKKYKRYNFQIINIMRDSNISVLNNFVTSHKIYDWYNILSTDNLLKKFHVPALPTKFLINRKGKIIGRWRGGGIENLKSIETKIRQYLTFTNKN